MGKPITQWEIENSGTLGEGAEYTPVGYPRSGDDRAISVNNKGAASSTDSINDAVATNSTGDVNVPRHVEGVNYKVGPYPVVVDDDMGGVDEAEGK